MSLNIKQLRGLSKSSVVVRDVDSVIILRFEQTIESLLGKTHSFFILRIKNNPGGLRPRDHHFSPGVLRPPGPPLRIYKVDIYTGNRPSQNGGTAGTNILYSTAPTL